MKQAILFYTFCFAVAFASVNFLDTNGTTVLTLDAELISPFGEYKAKLLRNCSISIQHFNATNKTYYSYSMINTTNQTNVSSCANITLNLTKQGLYVNNDKQIYKILPNQTYVRLRFGINDNGIIYLEGSSDPKNEVKTVYYISPTNKTQSGDVLYTLKNLTEVTKPSGWKFVFTNQTLTITNADQSIKKTFNISGVAFNETGVYDAQGQHRYAIIPGMALQPRARNQSCNQFENLFYRISDFYPVMRVFDDKNYQVAEFSLQYEGAPSTYCPQRTFEYLSNCVPKCPYPYYAEIRGKTGKCVLKCEFGSIVDEINLLCYSNNYKSGINFPIECIRPASLYVFGCYCSQDYYYSFLNDTCVKACPHSTIGIQGVCAPCPGNCQKCSIDPLNITKVKCDNCATDYSGKCVKSTCAIANCSKCSDDSKTCLQCSPFYALTNGSTKCEKQCGRDEVLIVGPNAEGYCYNISSFQNTTPSDYVGGFCNGKAYVIRKNCSDSQYVQGDKCVKACASGFAVVGKRCVCSGANETYINGFCQGIGNSTLGMYYNSTYQTYLNCPTGCVACTYQHCLSCGQEYVLIVSELGSTCRKNSVYFSCDSNFYQYDPINKICMSANVLPKSANSSQNCRLKDGSKCLFCDLNHVLSPSGQCVTTCPANYFPNQGQCLRTTVPNCVVGFLDSQGLSANISYPLLNNSPYKTYSRNGADISVDPMTEIFAVRDLLSIQSPSSSSPTVIYSAVPSCQQCSQGFFVWNGSCVEVQKILSFCQKQNLLTPYRLVNGTCVGSCPVSSYPVLNPNPQNGVDELTCITTGPWLPAIKLDSAVYKLSNENGITNYLYYFIVDQYLNENYPVKIYEKYYSTSRRLQQVKSRSEIINFIDQTHLAINSTADEVVVDFRNVLNELTASGPKQTRLGTAVYGVAANRSHPTNSSRWLAIIAYVLSIILILLHALYIGNDLLYKVDNALIFAQCMYFFSFIRLMIGEPIAQYYYGFLWSHFGFFPNYFAGLIPKGYVEGYSGNQINQYLPEPYRLLVGDANFIRNAGFSFSVLATFLAALIVVIIVIQLLKLCGWYELWYRRIAKQAFFAGIEFTSTSIFYWAVAHLISNQTKLFSPAYSGQPLNYVQYRKSCSIAAICWICIYGIYTFIRFIFHSVGGLYSLKRIAMATIIAASVYRYQHNNLNGMSRNVAFVALICFTEIMFMAFRCVIERPYLMRQNCFIAIEGIAMIAAYLTIYLWNDTGFVSVYVSIVFLVFILLFVEDLVDVYNDSQDQFYEENVFLPGTATTKPARRDTSVVVQNHAIPDTNRHLRHQDDHVGKQLV